MDGQQQRGRSPSAPGRNFILGSSPAHHFQGNNESSGQALDPALLSDPALLDNKSSGPGLATYDISTPYLESSSQGPLYSQRPNTNLAPNQILGSSYVPDDPNQNLSSSSPFPGQQQQQGNYSELSTSDAGNQFSPFQNNSGAQDQSFDAFLLDPSLQGNNEQAPNQSINPADLMTDMASAHHATPPPHLSRQQSSPIHQVSPGMLETRYRSSSQSRPNSLDPSSAAFTQNNHTDWTGMLQSSNFQNHRRTPSEHSDVSSSVAPSPFLANDGNIDGGEHQASPMLNAQQDGSLFPEGLGIEHFTLSEANQQSRISPGHSPLISPRQSPQRGLSPGGGGPFMFPPEGQQGPFGPASGQGIYTGQAQDQFPTLVGQDIDDMGQAGQMAPPEINIEFASSSQAFEPSKPLDDGNALSPPDRGRKARMRAKSDPYTGGSPISRPLGAGASSPRLGPTESRQRSLSPLDIVTGPVISGASSPSQKSSRRSSTSSIPNRDYILDLADPQRPGSNATDSKRVQKHPATFQCTLCPKRFTRAYNLRSHLRTHTDERPFVCTVCGKAFARQHDRKRHEGLHSGEKKFVCKGELQSGNSWGCGRRFARADALGRHFRSEAGRVCIRPLLDEEALERQRVWNEGQMMAQGQGQAQPPPMDFAGIDANGNYTLPQALLAQYPALATLSWDNMGPPGPDDDDISGRSNYDASSGGEYYDDEGEGSGYVSGPGTGYSSRQVGNWSGNGY